MSQVYQGILNTVSTEPTTVSVDGPWLEYNSVGGELDPHARIFLGDTYGTDGIEGDENNITRNYLDTSRREDHLNFIHQMQLERAAWSVEEGEEEVILDPQRLVAHGEGERGSVAAAPGSSGSLSGGSARAFGSLYGLPAVVRA